MPRSRITTFWMQPTAPRFSTLTFFILIAHKLPKQNFGVNLMKVKPCVKKSYINKVLTLIQEVEFEKKILSR